MLFTQWLKEKKEMNQFQATRPSTFFRQRKKIAFWSGGKKADCRLRLRIRIAESRPSYFFFARFFSPRIAFVCGLQETMPSSYHKQRFNSLLDILRYTSRYVSKTHRRLSRTFFNWPKQDRMQIFEGIVFFKATNNTQNKERNKQKT